MFVYLAFLIGLSHGLNNGLGRTPQMGKIIKSSASIFIIYSFYVGWNDWNHYHRNISEKIIQHAADAIVSTGLAAAGYEYGVFFRY
jgi:hypothetical protein